jgi:hypothetical protein
MISITLLAPALGRLGGGAATLSNHPAGTVEKSAGQTQTNEINVAKECATTCSPLRQCHIDPGCREKQLLVSYIS